MDQVKTKIILSFFNKWEQKILKNQKELLRQEDKENIDINYWRDQLKIRNKHLKQSDKKILLEQKLQFLQQEEQQIECEKQQMEREWDFLIEKAEQINQIQISQESEKLKTQRKEKKQTSLSSMCFEFSIETDNIDTVFSK